MTIEGLGTSASLAWCQASALDSEHLAVELEAPALLLRSVSQQMLRGSLPVQYRGARLVLTRFTIFNQSDRERLVFRAAHQPA